MKKPHLCLSTHLLEILPCSLINPRFFFPYRFHSYECSSSRPFPDYSPKKPTIRDSDFVHQISTSIKQRRLEPLPRVLKPFELHFKPDHFIWVLAKIRNDFSLVLGFFDWARARKKLSLEAQCIVAHISIAYKHPETAHSLIRDLLMGRNLDKFSVRHFIEQVIYTYKDWGPDPLIYDIVFQVLVRAWMVDEARSFFHRMLNYGVIIDVHSCNFLLTHLSSSGIGNALKVFGEFSESGLCWNTASYNIIIHGLCIVDRVKEAHILLVEMESKGYPPDVITFSTVIDGYCRVGELQTALDLVEEMSVKGLNPNAFVYNSIIVFLCKKNKVVDAEKVLRQMISNKIGPDNVVYTTLIDGFCKIGNLPDAFRLMDEMRSLGLFPDTITYTALISGLCQSGKIDEAVRIFQEMGLKGLAVDEIA